MLPNLVTLVQLAAFGSALVPDGMFDNSTSTGATPTTNSTTIDVPLAVVGKGICYKANRPKPSPSPIAPPAEEWKPAPQPQGPVTGGSTKPSGGGGIFSGTQTGIGSFFRSNLGSDDTNGQSWCSYKYKDYSRGFAPDLRQLTDGTLAKWGHPQWGYFGDRGCGLEAIVTNVDTGKSLTLYIIDAFDPSWVKSPGSIDIMAGAWEELAGVSAYDKNHVLNVKWYLTGNRSDKYCYGCGGDP